MYLDTIRIMTYSVLPHSLNGKVILASLLLIGIVLRFGALTWGIPDREDQSSIYHDEGHVLGYVLMGSDSFKNKFGEYEIVRPVYFWRIIGRPIIEMGTSLGINNEETRKFELGVLRAITATVAIVGLFAMYLLGRSLGSDSTGLWALAFLTFMPGHWYYSQILKGDVMVATFFILILLIAISIARNGNRWAYIAAGIVFGAGVAIKATTIIAAPVLLLAHLFYTIPQKRLSAVFSLNAFVLLACVIVSFLLLYPYPFIGLSRLQHLLSDPTTQSFSPVLFVSPQKYINVWNEYNLPLKPFGEMVYGKLLVWAFIPLLFGVTIIAVREYMQRKRADLLLVVVLALLFMHSLTFTAVLDERYLLPSAPFAALFPALMITGVGLPRSKSIRMMGIALGSIILAWTVAITWVTFPSFAWDNPREQVLEWISDNVPKGAVIAQPSNLSRWALRINRDVYSSVTFVAGEGDTRSIPKDQKIDYVILQRDPWNYDHSFRYELEGLEVELGEFLQGYVHVRQFGDVPHIFRWRIPQNLGTPVIDIYKAL